MLISSLHQIAEFLGTDEAFKQLGEHVKVILVDKDIDIINSIAFRIDLIIQKFVYIPPDKNDDEDDLNNGNLSPNGNL